MAQERPNIFTVEFWQNTITNSVYAFASGALGPLIANQANLIHSVPWYAAVSSGAIGMLIVFLGSFATNQIPNRVPGSFLKETDEEERIERMILREERLALERKRIRETIDMDDDRHRAPEPERYTPTDDFIVTGVPPERRVPVRPPVEQQTELTEQYINQQRRPPPQPPPQMMSPNPPQRTERQARRGPPTQPIPQPPKPVPPQEDSMENWPQGGRRGKQSRGE